MPGGGGGPGVIAPDTGGGVPTIDDGFGAPPGTFPINNPVFFPVPQPGTPQIGDPTISPRDPGTAIAPQAGPSVPLTSQQEQDILRRANEARQKRQDQQVLERAAILRDQARASFRRQRARAGGILSQILTSALGVPKGQGSEGAVSRPLGGTGKSKVGL